MATSTSGADALRAAAADLDLIAQAHAAALAADEHLTATVRDVLDRRLVTVEQVAQVLGVHRRTIYKRLA
jgi:transcriptional regulator of acetoin/glycerol metabolism